VWSSILSIAFWVIRSGLLAGLLLMAISADSDVAQQSKDTIFSNQ